MASSARLTRLAGWTGIVTPVFTLSAIFISVAMSPWFSWHDNALSDMGVSQSNPFNAALLIGGGLYLVFVLGLARWYGARSLLAKLALCGLIIGGVGMTLVGIFTEAAGRIHYAVAATYFLFTPAAYLLLGVDLLRRGEKISGVLTIAAGITALVMIGLVPHKRIAVPEILASTILAAWTFAMGVKMLIEPTLEK